MFCMLNSTLYSFCYSDEGGITQREQHMRFLLRRNENKTNNIGFRQLL